MLLLVLSAVALAVAGLLWTAGTLTAAERDAEAHDTQWRTADAWLSDATCRDADGQALPDREPLSAAGGGEVRRVHASGGCWVEVVTAGGEPLVGAWIADDTPTVTPVAGVSPSALPVPESGPEIGASEPAPQPAPRRRGPAPGPSWLDLRQE